MAPTIKTASRSLGSTASTRSSAVSPGVGSAAASAKPTDSGLLEVLSEGLGSEKSEALLRDAGRRMAEGRGASEDGVRSWLEEAVAVLNELGGLAELEEHNEGFAIRGYGCPLAGVTPEHPEACRMAETLISELAGVPVYEHCDRGAKPRCCFEVVLPESTAQ